MLLDAVLDAQQVDVLGTQMVFDFRLAVYQPAVTFVEAAGPAVHPVPTVARTAKMSAVSSMPTMRAGSDAASGESLWNLSQANAPASATKVIPMTTTAMPSPLTRAACRARAEQGAQGDAGEDADHDGDDGGGHEQEQERVRQHVLTVK